MEEAFGNKDAEQQNRHRDRGIDRGTLHALNTGGRYLGPAWLVLDRPCFFDCLKGVSKSVQKLLNGIEAGLVLTLIILK